MVDRRIREGVERPETVTFRFEGREIPAVIGETVAAALWAAGEIALRRSSGRGEPRAVFCNMGICFECIVRIDGRPVRSCMTQVIGEGMMVERGGIAEPGEGSS